MERMKKTLRPNYEVLLRNERNTGEDENGHPGEDTGEQYLKALYRMVCGGGRGNDVVMTW